MTEQIQTETVQAEAVQAEAVQTETPIPAQAGPVPVLPVPEQPAKPKKSRKPLLWGIARWTAAVLVCGGVGTGTAMGITAMDRTDVPGLATESDGRWEYPKLALPALPEGALRPYTDGNDGEIHHADLRKLLLPAPAGATVDPKLNGGWVGLDSYLALLKEKDRGPVKQYLADSALRHVAAGGWTTPDGTTTRIHLLRFSSVAFSEAFKDEVTREVSEGGRLPVGVESAEIDTATQGVDVPYLSVYSYQEDKPYGPEQTRWAYVQAGDTFAVVTQTRKGGALTVPFQQTVALQAQLLG
ncbi:hypothetical protein [Streptomyces sp. NRRL B-24572]|uniref:hypothetical protein n=1 Tax=Streptomyces sp. NRRL B-24572 TaxID=1962156 RepID=UPI0015C51A45|nr:hypothetical protein [Streptomyces sp. NRRL B-24572]